MFEYQQSDYVLAAVLCFFVFTYIMDAPVMGILVPLIMIWFAFRFVNK